MEAVAANLGASAELVERAFYADHEEEQVLTDLGPAWSAQTGKLGEYSDKSERG